MANALSPPCPDTASHDLILRASRERVTVQRAVLARLGTGDTLHIRDAVRRALNDDTITEAQVDRVLAAHRERRHGARAAVSEGA